ncbi:tumor necrosis factor receptor superfamily member 16 [Takifugu rubripes]|uniref:Nerve growth factor receptor b n=1 Tax=Takifugu rubripes TaxID=31033 RepID=A0A3B5K0W8_TAKRU|nr:tumor necrosis factor receptor superfamily member 16 [Takifugu rubripes]|eukprot:XP_011600969.1 PREDICTED: tumor necrosis factor receptor superfamily member 16 [Takifugu rubripes]
MKPAFELLLLAAVGALANKENCLSGQYTTSGECCQQCQPGEGVVTPCGDTQTECAPCLDSETFSQNFSHTDECQPCTICTGLLVMKTPCTDSNDAICTCKYGYYMNTLSQRCEPCTMCLEGHGVLLSCELDHDTLCEECEEGTYSDQESLRDPCIPCTSCDDSSVIHSCTPVTDAICEVTGDDPSVPYTTFSMQPSDDNLIDEIYPEVTTPTATTTTTTTTTTINGNSKTPIYNELNDKLIPIYCSILAAVVVGLVAFIIFKRWNSCKQNKQGANNCTTIQNQTPSPEEEKLHSDSGISVNSQSQQEQQVQTQTGNIFVTIDEDPCPLPLHTREKVEKLLFRGGEADGQTEDSDWCNLAGLLGYEEERIAAFRQEEHPVCALLSDWGGKDSASIDTLCTALRKINRDDVAQSLVLSPNPKPTATSVV